MSSSELECRYALVHNLVFSTTMYESLVRCAVCQELDSNANVDEVNEAVLIVAGINKVDDEIFHYVPPQHKECTLKYQINKVAPEL